MSKRDEHHNHTYGSIDDALMAMHDMAMSGDQFDACHGRMGKAIGNAITAWLQDEARRGTDLPTCILAAKSASLSALFTVLVNAVPDPTARIELAKFMRDEFIKEYDSCVSKLDKPTLPTA